MKFGLVGNSLNHSFSKQYFTEKFLNPDYQNFEYHNFEIDQINQIKDLVHKHHDLVGFNITFPFKETILPFLDWIDPYAASIGAVNVVVIQRFNNQNRLLGFNTDVLGFKQSLIHLILASRPSALVLGTGGASKAVCTSLSELEIPFEMVSRNPIKGIPYELLNESHFKNFKLIINTTPLGTFPNIDTKPNIPYQFISGNHYLYDLVYNPIETAFLKEGKNRGAMVKNGYEMLVIQAEASWDIWNHYI